MMADHNEQLSGQNLIQFEMWVNYVFFCFYFSWLMTTSLTLRMSSTRFLVVVEHQAAGSGWTDQINNQSLKTNQSLKPVMMFSGWTEKSFHQLDHCGSGCLVSNELHIELEILDIGRVPLWILCICQKLL